MISIKENVSFKRKERLSKKEIRELFKKGKRIRVQDYIGIYLYNQKPFPKLGFSIKKKWVMLSLETMKNVWSKKYLGIQN